MQYETVTYVFCCYYYHSMKNKFKYLRNLCIQIQFADSIPPSYCFKMNVCHLCDFKNQIFFLAALNWDFFLLQKFLCLKFSRSNSDVASQVADRDACVFTIFEVKTIYEFLLGIQNNRIFYQITSLFQRKNNVFNFPSIYSTVWVDF